MAYKFNPFVGNFDIDTGTKGRDIWLREYDTDPSPSVEETAWILRQLGYSTTNYTPLGILASITHTNTIPTPTYDYFFSYRTKGTTTTVTAGSPLGILMAITSPITSTLTTGGTTRRVRLDI